MKTQTLILAAALFLSGAGFAGCSDSDEAPTAAGTPPVAPSQEITNFFDAHLSENSTDFNFSNIEGSDDISTECFHINTVEQFREIAPEPIVLPDIDFAKYSLIVGQHVFGSPSYSLESQAVETGADALTLNLVYRVLQGAAPTVMTTYYFWGLYDKLPEYEVNVNIVTF